MKREVQPVGTDERGYEVHPAFGMARAARVSSTPGAVLFDSELRHQHYVILSISGAERKRDLKRDWIHSTKRVVEIAMSEAQWAQLVSSMNTEGTPVTLTDIGSEQLPQLPYEPRMAVQMDEVKKAVAEQLSHIQEALAAYEARPTKAGLRSLRFAVENTPNNVAFAAEALAEHVENTVTRAKADIEAMVAHAEARGIEGAGLLIELESGNEGEVPHE